MRIRPVGVEDHDFLRRMLYEAAAWRPGMEYPPPEELLAAPELAKLLQGWGRAGDHALIAEDDGHRAGAAWYRLWTAGDHSYGYVGEDVPELGLAVVPGRRGAGVGTALLRALMTEACDHGFRRLSLSVEIDNPARRLYSRHGFVACGRVGNADTMVADLEIGRQKGVAK